MTASGTPVARAAASVREQVGTRLRTPFVSGRWASVPLLREHCPGLGLLLAGSGLLAALLPSAVIVTGGLLVGRAVSFSRDGWDPALLRQTSVLFGVTSVVLAGAFVIDLVQDALARVVNARLTYALQAGLAAAVGEPVGTAHLEDPRTLDRIALAQGSLSNFKPADAPGMLARVASARLSGVVACGVLGGFHWWFGLAVLALWLAVRVPLRRSILAHVRAFSGDARVMRRARYFQQLSASREAAKEIRLFGIGDWIVEQFRLHWLDGMAQVWRIRGRLHRRVLWTGAGVLAGYLAACAVLYRAVTQGELTATGVAVLVPALVLAPSVAGISFDDIALDWMTLGLPELGALRRDLRASATALPGSAAPTPSPAPEVRFEGVRFRYPGTDRDVYESLGLVLDAGRVTAVVGANGAGKTTLVKLLARLHDPVGGRLLVDGVDLASLDPRLWRRDIALIGQDFVRVPGSLADNVGFGSVASLTDREGMRRALADAGGEELPDELPRGWDTPLATGGVPGADLSRGQWQRVALARALFAVRHGARLLVLDEPTAWLDARAEADFYDRFLTLVDGVTTLVISHRFGTVRQAHTIHVLDAGRVVESGSHDRLVAGDGWYARMFRLQADRLATAAAAGPADLPGGAG
ncbi:ABC transporter ATP-binding protein [Streptomyces chartreusis]|uniref:ABC transporter ATP-binding protein n=1 Tax=Streptomyces chartreusis TaxID=1969 RepID=UPI0033A078A2